MSYYTDIAVYGPDGHLQLLAETKGVTGQSAEWAAQIRSNLYLRGDLPAVPYFLLALPDRFYLWKDVAKSAEIVAPDFVVDAEPSLRPYIKGLEQPVAHLDRWSMGLFITAWLEILARYYDQAPVKDQDWLKDSGLAGAIRGGVVEVQELV